LFVASAADLSRTQAATLIATGNVTVNDKREKASYRVEPGDSVRVQRPELLERQIVGESIPLSIVHEDDDLLVVDKPAGMVVHPAPGNWTGTLVNALMGREGDLAQTEDPTRAGIVHRLDKETSGLLVVAKNETAHRKLSRDLAARTVVRRYAVMSWGHLDEDRITIDKPIARDPRDRKRMAIVATGRESRTELVRLARFHSGDFLRAHLHTGRTHQIRVHLASAGHPVMGDDTYGGGGGRRLVGLPPKRHFLHAAWLRFAHPITGAQVDLRAPLPPDLRASLAAINDDAMDLGDNPLETLGFFNE
jgi:23S rRNA pseudouridine1911/1915/1917 synthase